MMNHYDDNLYDVKTSQLAWKLFYESGEPGYYMLYSEIKEKEEKSESERNHC